MAALYECVFIVRPDATTNDVHKITDWFKANLEANNAVVKKSEYWGLRILAYNIAKNKKGHYVMIAFEGEAASVNEMERNFRNNESIIRYLTMRIDEIAEGPSLMMQVPLNSAELNSNV